MTKIKSKLNTLIVQFFVWWKLGVFHKTTLHRLKMLELAFRYVRDEKVVGTYMEFGVARGKTFISAYHLSRKQGFVIKKFHALDSFEGFPTPKGIDTIFERFKQGEENWSLNIFKKNLIKQKVNTEKIEIHEGWFKDTWTKDKVEELKMNSEKISVGWIDCDMYESTKDVLTHIAPLLQQGTILIFDDWFCYRADPEKGEQKAVNEFLTKHKNISLIPFFRFGVVGNSFVVNIK